MGKRVKYIFKLSVLYFLRRLFILVNLFCSVSLSLGCLLRGVQEGVPHCLVFLLTAPAEALRIVDIVDVSSGVPHYGVPLGWKILFATIHYELKLVPNH